MRIIALVLLTSIANCYSQSPFRKNFGSSLGVLPAGVGDVWNGGNPGFFETLDGGYLILGSTNSDGAGGYDMLLAKILSDGDTGWVKTYGSALDEYGCSVAFTPDSGYLVVGASSPDYPDTQALVVRVNSMGDVVWSRTFSPVLDVDEVLPDGDGGFVMCGRAANQPPLFNYGTYLMKIDSTGDIVWSRSFAAYALELSPMSLMATEDEGYLLSGVLWLATQGHEYGYLIHTDHDGGLLWARAYRSTYSPGDNNMHIQGVAGSEDGNYLACGKYFLDGLYSCNLLMTVDPNGDPLWSKAYPAPALGANDNDGSSLVKMNNGTIATSGSDGIIIRTDPEGNLISSTYYDRFQRLSLRRSATGGLLLSGVDLAGHSQIGFAMADNAGSIDCVQWPFPVMETDSVVEPVPLVVVTQDPSIVGSDTPLAQGWCPGTLADCGSVGTVDAGSDRRPIWVENPASDRIILHGTQPGGRVVVMNLMGTELSSVRSSDALTVVEIPDWPTGTYILHYLNSSIREGFKVMKTD